MHESNTRGRSPKVSPNPNPVQKAKQGGWPHLLECRSNQVIVGDIYPEFHKLKGILVLLGIPP